MTTQSAQALPSRRVAWLLVLSALIVLSAISVIYSSYKARKLFSELQDLHRVSMRLEEEWGRLLLEQSTWASHTRIEQLAKEQLHMIVPGPSETVLVSR